MPPPDATPAPRIPDHELLRRIGTGSYGDVWLARSVTGQWRAVKVVHRARFDRDKPYEREFAGLKKFEPVSRGHASQVDILHVGRDDAAGFFYYVMEPADDEAGGPLVDPDRYVPKTLRGELRKGPLPVAVCLRLGVSLTTALQHLHDNRLVHRDVKPSNIIYIAGEPKLADIGLVTDLESTRSFVGTEGYLPPEGPGTPSADFYALGKVLYEAAFGRDRLDFPEVPTMLSESPERAQLLELNEIILKCCASEPKERYRNGAELRADLERLQRGGSIKQRRDLARTTKLGLKIAGVALLLVAVGFAARIFWPKVPPKKETSRADATHSNATPTQTPVKSPAIAPIIRGPTLLPEEGLIGSGSTGQAVAQLADAVRTNRLDAPAAARRLIEVLSGGAFLVPDQPPLTHDGEIYDLAFSPDGRRLAVSVSGRRVQVWDLSARTAKELADPKMPRFHGLLRYSPDGQRLLIACPSRPSHFMIADTATGGLVRPPITEGTSIVRAEFLPDGRRFVAAGIDGVSVWDSRTGERLERLSTLTNGFRHLAVSPDGRWALAVVESPANAPGPQSVLVNLETRQVVTHLDLDKEHITGGWFSPDSQRLLAGGLTAQAFIWELATGRRVSPPLKHHDTIFSGAWLPDGRRVLTGSRDTMAQMWDATTGEVFGEPLNHLGMIYVIKPGPDGRFFATGADGYIRLWRGADGRPAVTPIRHSADTIRFAFSPDGRLLATGARDGSVMVWRLPNAAEAGRDPSTLAVVRDALRALEKNFPPPWLPDLAEELAGRALGGPKHVALFTQRARYAQIRQTVLATEDMEPLGRWGRWLLGETAAPTEGPPSPDK